MRTGEGQGGGRRTRSWTRDGRRRGGPSLLRRFVVTRLRGSVTLNVPGMWAFVVMTVTLVAARYCEVYAVILASWNN